MMRRSRSQAYHRRREEVLDFAARLINSEGVANATLSAVAEELGVRHNTIYHYFKDREQLHRATLDRTLTLREESLDAALHVEGDGLDKLSAYLQRELEAEPDSRVDAAGGRGLRAGERKRLIERKQKQMHQLADLIQGGIDEGTMAPCDPVVRAFALDAIVNRFLVPSRTFPRGVVPLPVAHQVMDILLNGILLRERRMPEVEHNTQDMSVVLGLELDKDDVEGAELRALLGNAARCFNEQGWDASIPAMAARVQKSKTVYYQIAADKQELLFHCLARGLTLIAASHRASNWNGDNPAHAIVLHYNYLYRSHDSGIGPLPLFNEEGRLHPHHRRLINIRTKSLRMRAERRIRNGISGGWFRELPSHVIQSILGAMLWDLDLGIYGERTSLTYEDVARENVRLVFEGLTAS